MHKYIYIHMMYAQIYIYILYTHISKIWQQHAITPHMFFFEEIHVHDPLWSEGVPPSLKTHLLP